MEPIVTALEKLLENTRELNCEQNSTLKKLETELDRFNIDEKSEYTIPLPDTIGKGYYQIGFHKH